MDTAKEKRDKRNAYIREWRRKNREKFLARRRWRYAQNPEKFRQARRNDYYKDPSKAVAAAAKYNREHKEYHNLLSRISQANARYPGKITIRDVKDVIERCGAKCYWCGKPGLSGRDVTIEHLKPVNDARFITIACFSCNAAKIPLFGPRKTREEKLRIKREKEKTRQASMTPKQIEQCRARTREWKRKRRAERV